MPLHHPDESLLIEYAAGSLGEAKALLVATHLALCPSCRAAVASGEVVGAVLAFSESEAAVGPAPDPADRPVERPQSAVMPPPLSPVPEPLRSYLGRPVSDLRWSSAWPGMRAYALPEFAGRARVRLLSIRPGRAMPRHTHRGQELTLVLQGSFSDATGAYAKGDVATADPSVDHQPRADASSECLCLAVEDAPLRVSDWLGALRDAVRSVRAR